MSDLITVWLAYLRALFPGYFIVMAMHIVWGFLATAFLIVWRALFDEPRPTADKVRQYVWRAMLLGLLPAAYTARLVEVDNLAITSYLAVAMIVAFRDMMQKSKEVSRD